jgi:predicted ATPase
MTENSFLDQIELRRERIPSFDKYPFSIPAIRQLTTLKLHPRVTYFVGENGSGKSTLLEAIAVAEGFNPEGGSRNFSFATRESHSELFRSLRISRYPRLLRDTDGYFFRAESYFNVATQIEELERVRAGLLRSYGGISLHEQSHGESFFSLLLNRLGGNGLYLFDEPESALSPSRQLSMLAAMHDLIQTGSQFLIATHSPIILGYPDATILEFSSEGIRQVEYEDTEQFRVTRAFLTQRERMLAELFRDVPE